MMFLALRADMLKETISPFVFVFVATRAGGNRAEQARVGLRGGEDHEEKDHGQTEGVRFASVGDSRSPAQAQTVSGVQ